MIVMVDWSLCFVGKMWELTNNYLGEIQCSREVQGQVLESHMSGVVQILVLIVVAMVLITDILTFIALQWDLFPSLYDFPQFPSNDPLQSGGKCPTSSQRKLGVPISNLSQSILNPDSNSLVLPQ